MRGMLRGRPWWFTAPMAARLGFMRTNGRRYEARYPVGLRGIR